jgi:hypothetical protein
LADIKKSATSLGDLKLLTTEMKAVMAEVRETSKTMSSVGPAPAISIGTSTPMAKPISIKPISSPSSSTSIKPIASVTKSDEPLKAGITYARKKEEESSTTAVTKPADKKKGKTPPIVIEVFQLIENRAKGGASANALAKIIENARDTISKSWKWHPILYEVGTFARKLRKYGDKTPGQEVLTLLFQKLDEWKDKMVEEDKK